MHRVCMLVVFRTGHLDDLLCTGSGAMISALCKVVINLILQYSPGLAAVHDTQFCEVLAAFDLQGLQPVHKGIALQAVYLLAAQSQLCSDTLNTTHLRHQLFGCLAISPEQWTHLDAERTGVVQQAMRCLHVLGRVAWKEEATMAEAQQIAIMGQIVLRNCADELVREVVEMLLVIPPEMQPFQSGQVNESYQSRGQACMHHWLPDTILGRRIRRGSP
eukprot:TRINITY_DN12591_c0_g1_i23.p1 TRINITY_DN12591_c0_g1~~TRINITY_DN12591_c0_g1_i23.p1  ORF type:complete len:218 (+),score=28.13 TRINITY_DN12591_c0_g1_i23:667-1320(+)